MIFLDDKAQMIKYPPSDLFNGQVLVQSTRVLQIKINPPRKSTRTLSRLRVLEALNEAINHRLTVLQAGAGYGKRTALAELTELHQPVAWYQVTEAITTPWYSYCISSTPHNVACPP